MTIIFSLSKGFCLFLFIYNNSALGRPDVYPFIIKRFGRIFYIFWVKGRVPFKMPVRTLADFKGHPLIKPKKEIHPHGRISFSLSF